MVSIREIKKHPAGGFTIVWEFDLNLSDSLQETAKAMAAQIEADQNARILETISKKER